MGVTEVLLRSKSQLLSGNPVSPFPTNIAKLTKSLTNQGGGGHGTGAYLRFQKYQADESL